jgi:hypothetical protein
VFTTSPSGAVHNVAFATEPVVTVKDAESITVAPRSRRRLPYRHRGHVALGAAAGGGLISAISNPFMIL